MPRYYRSGNLQITNIEPESMIYVDTEEGRQVYLGRCNSDTLIIQIPEKETVLVRIRHREYKSFETQTHLREGRATTVAALRVPD